MHKSFRSLAGARPLALAALSVAIVGALVAPSAAHASAFQLKEDTPQAMGRAYAGSATAGGDVSVVANNPGCHERSRGHLLQADITAINFGPVPR
jgi:long-chain fatty acid transport protein